MERSWRYRRLMVFIIVLSCLAMLFIGLWVGGSDLVRQSVVQGAFLTLISVAGAYLGIAEWSDRNKAKELLAGITGKPDQPQQEQQQ